MNRAEFFSQVKNNFSNAAKELISPLIEDDIEKIDSIIDEFAGFKWYYLGDKDSLLVSGVIDKFINNHAIFIYPLNEELKAVSKVCNDCNSIVNFLSYDRKFKCFKCNNELLIKTNEGSLNLKNYRLKLTDKKYFIALN